MWCILMLDRAERAQCVRTPAEQPWMTHTHRQWRSCSHCLPRYFPISPPSVFPLPSCLTNTAHLSPSIILFIDKFLLWHYTYTLLSQQRAALKVLWLQFLCFHFYPSRILLPSPLAVILVNNIYKRQYHVCFYILFCKHLTTERSRREIGDENINQVYDNFKCNKSFLISNKPIITKWNCWCHPLESP